MIREIIFCLSVIFLLNVFTTKAQEQPRLDYIRIVQTEWFDARLSPIFICKLKDSSKLKYQINEAEVGNMYVITTVTDDVYDSLVAYVVGYSPGHNSRKFPCSACYEISYNGLTTIKYKTQSDAESKKYFEEFSVILSKNPNQTWLKQIVKGILERFESDPAFKDKSASYIKITTTALNRDKYYPPIIICSDTAISKVLRDTFWTTFLIEPEVHNWLENYIKASKSPSGSNEKGRCDHCFDVSVFEKREKVFSYEVKTNEESAKYVSEMEEKLKLSSNSDYLIVLIRGYLSFH